MVVKKISLSLIAICAGSISLGAYAADLTQDLVLNNNTNNFITSKLNTSICSSSIPGGSGVIKPHETGHKVSGILVSMVCAEHSTQCRADVHLDNHCGGQAIATVILDAKNSKVVSVEMHSTAYQISHSGFSFTLNPA